MPGCQIPGVDDVPRGTKEAFASKTAGPAARSDVPRAAPDERAGDVRRRLVGERFASASEIAVLDDGLYVGVIPIERLLAADDTALVAELVEDDIPVRPEVDLETATRLAARRGSRVVAVADGPRFLGLVPPDRLLAALEREHEEDLARLGGFLSQASAARMASEERVVRRLWHRLPWLLLGLLGAMASTVIVGAFEDELRDEVLLALFIPAVVYMADAVGTQTEAVVIRGMALGVPVRAVLARELATGAVVGTLIGVLFVPFAYVAWGDGRVALVVGISLWISCAVATLVAMGLPYALARLGRDPAYGSGPLATVIQDLLSIAAYFGVAVLLVT